LIPLLRKKITEKNETLIVTGGEAIVLSVQDRFDARIRGEGPAGREHGQRGGKGDRLDARRTRVSKKQNPPAGEGGGLLLGFSLA
jgi:hypothetical protein